MYILSWFVKMKNLFAKISLFQLSDSLVQPQPQGAYVISINKIGSEQRREPHHLGIYVTAQVQVLYCEEGRRISNRAWFEFGANKFQDDGELAGPGVKFSKHTSTRQALGLWLLYQSVRVPQRQVLVVFLNLAVDAFLIIKFL